MTTRMALTGLGRTDSDGTDRPGRPARTQTGLGDDSIGVLLMRKVAFSAYPLYAFFLGSVAGISMGPLFFTNLLLNLTTVGVIMRIRVLFVSVYAALLLVAACLLHSCAFASAPSAPLPLFIGPKVSHDFNLDLNDRPIPHLELNDRNVAVYAWNTFFALNMPGLPVNSGQRGMRNPKKEFGAVGPTVWNTYKEKRELFRIIATDRLIKEDEEEYVAVNAAYAYDPSDPGSFDQVINFDQMSPNIPPCTDKDRVGPDEVWNFLDESQEIGLATVWLGGERPSNDSLVRTQVKMNRSYYNYIRETGYYATDTLNNAIKSAIAPGPLQFGPVQLPMGNPRDEGAILVKSSWVKKTRLPAELQEHYYNVKAMYFDDQLSEAAANSASASTAPSTNASTSRVCYRVDEFSLIGIHFIHKTTSFPQFLYTTFENRHNEGLTFVYANSLGKASTLPNAFHEPYTHPRNPQPGLQNPPYDVHFKLNPPRPVVSEVNAAALELIKANFPQAVWQYYRLVGLQFAPADTPDDRVNRQQDYYLANPVIETSQRFQKFTGTFALSKSVNVLPYPYGSRPPVQMGGCMGCHGAGAQGAPFDREGIIQGGGGTDFSFILHAVRSPPEDQGVETLIHPALTQIIPDP